MPNMVVVLNLVGAAAIGPTITDHGGREGDEVALSIYCGNNMTNRKLYDSRFLHITNPHSQPM